jgi:hypothetical protein
MQIRQRCYSPAEAAVSPAPFDITEVARYLRSAVCSQESPS